MASGGLRKAKTTLPTTFSDHFWPKYDFWGTSKNFDFSWFFRPPDLPPYLLTPGPPEVGPCRPPLQMPLKTQNCRGERKTFPFGMRFAPIAPVFDLLSIPGPQKKSTIFFNDVPQTFSIFFDFFQLDFSLPSSRKAGEPVVIPPDMSRDAPPKTRKCRGEPKHFCLDMRFSPIDPVFDPLSIGGPQKIRRFF